MDYFKNLVEQISTAFNQLQAKQKMLVIVTVTLTIGSLLALIVWANRTDYKTLYTGLSNEDAGAIVNKLREKKIEYKVGADGTSIMVPADSVYEVRMEMASEGLPQSGGVGYEIFDQQNIGVTEFVQKVNYRRALQGELARTIKQFAEVKHARVHLTIPEKTLFLKDQEKPRASVVLTLHSGRGLRENQMQGITHLVASSVEGLDPENVIIVDSHGKLIAGGQDKFKYADMSMTQQELQTGMEKKLARKIESMLGNVVGPDKITARVSVEMDFTQVEQTEESYDPEKAAVRSEQRSSEKSSGKRPVASGVPGVLSNSPETQGGAAGGVKTSDFNKSDETINYEISRVTKRIVNQIGSLKRLNAAVLIDGNYGVEKGEDGKEVRKYIPRTEEEMKKYEALVERAVGFDEDRGDSVEVVNVQFHEAVAVEEGALGKIVETVDWQLIIKYVIWALLAAIFFIFALKPMIRALSKSLSEVRPVAEELPETARGREAVEGEELPAGVFEGDLERLGEKQTNLIGFAQKNPRLFAQYLKNWLT